MKKLLFLLLLLIAKAQALTVEMNPEILLPGDVADCKLVIANPIHIDEVVFFAQHGIKIEPQYVSVGKIPVKTRYTIPFTLTAEKAGIYTVNAIVRTSNGSIRQVMIVRVENVMPKIILNSSLTLNEVNRVGLKVVSPPNINVVSIEPLFDVLKIDKNSLTFYPAKPANLTFKIGFYNGQNYHEVIQTIKPEYRESRGIHVNTSSPSYCMLKDAIPIDVRITNLRNDEIHSIRISAGNSAIEIPHIKSMQSHSCKLFFSPDQPGSTTIRLEVEYMDEINQRHRVVKDIHVYVLNELTLSLSDLEIENGRISGEIINRGMSKAYNVLVASGNKSYYIGTINPSDFDSFELEGNSTLTVSWNNELGELVKVTQSIPYPEPEPKQKKASIGYSVLLPIIAIVVAIPILLRRLRCLKK